MESENQKFWRCSSRGNSSILQKKFGADVFGKLHFKGYFQNIPKSKYKKCH